MIVTKSMLKYHLFKLKIPKPHRRATTTHNPPRYLKGTFLKRYIWNPFIVTIQGTCKVPFKGTLQVPSKGTSRVPFRKGALKVPFKGTPKVPFKGTLVVPFKKRYIWNPFNVINEGTSRVPFKVTPEVPLRKVPPRYLSKVLLWYLPFLRGTSPP